MCFQQNAVDVKCRSVERSVAQDELASLESQVFFLAPLPKKATPRIPSNPLQLSAVETKLAAATSDSSKKAEEAALLRLEAERTELALQQLHCREGRTKQFTSKAVTHPRPKILHSVRSTVVSLHPAPPHP